MADFGLLSTGFAAKTFEVAREELNELVRAELGNSVDLSDNSILGRIIAIIAVKANRS